MWIKGVTADYHGATGKDGFYHEQDQEETDYDGNNVKKKVYYYVSNATGSGD